MTDRMETTDTTETPAPDRPHILLVDDDPLQRKLAAVRLRHEGFRVETAASAEQAFDLALGAPPDAIVSDVIMSGLDGFGLCRLVRKEPKLTNVPVVLLSAHYDESNDRALARRLGACSLVTRTPGFEAELEAIRQSLRTGPPPPDASGEATAVQDQLRSTARQLSVVANQARRAEQRYQALFDSASDVVSVLTPEGTVLEVNPRAEEVLGISRDRLIGRRVPELTAENPAAPGLGTGREKAERRVVPFARADGSTVQLEVSANPVEIDGETIILSIARDVTEKRRLEEHLRQAQKMEALGQLTGGIAHDFNNVLASILANSHFLLSDLSDGDPRRADADEIRASAERGAALTRQLLAFSRHQVLAPAALDLNVTLAGLERMLRRLIGEDIDLQLDKDAGLGTVMADAGQIEQVIMNLVVNSRDAMPTGGRISIETSNVDLTSGDLPGHQPATDGRYVMVAIRDNGCGMSAETKQRAFEPFFTTKERGKGTGLGLSTCYGIVKQSGGYIYVTSEVGEGTVFRIYLPRIDARPDQARAAVKETTELRGKETVLLVEDDGRVRNAMRRIVSSYGYNVLVAPDGKEAIALVVAQAHVDLVLSDVIIPGLSGPETVKEIHKHSPSTKALFMSGYTDHAILRDGTLQDGMNFIQKPFAPEALARKIREVLDA